VSYPIPKDTAENAATEALVVRAVATDDERGQGVDVVVCSLCGGPARLCGGVCRCIGGPTSTVERRWLIAIRAIYAGLLLTPTPAALWGGALLRFAHHVAPRLVALSVVDLAKHYADPSCPLSPTTAATLSCRYLHDGSRAFLHELRPLREARAPWLSALVALGTRAALTTPLAGQRYPLIAVRCDGCAAELHDDVPIDWLVAHVSSYDAAIRCPACGVVVPHPLAGIDVGEPHPVSRCLAGSAGRCLAHPGEALDAEGLCVHGRAVYDEAVAVIAGQRGTPTRRDCDVLDALLRAQRVRRGLPRELLPIFAALATVNPEIAQPLACLTGAPLDTAAADPELVERLTRPSGLSLLFTAIEVAVDYGIKRLMQRG
jgi:hypothetical protein